jgi:PTH1 family peptidyl-tRNA hydrolase
MNQNTILLTGLGNPGKEYKLTRHNIGWQVLDNYFKTLTKNTLSSPETIFTLVSNFSFSKKHQAQLAIIQINQQKIILLKPETMMNNSGQAIKSIVDYYKIPLQNILVIHDDLSFALGNFKLSKNSGPAGHNGVKSIIQQLNTRDFSRLRIGIASLNTTCSVNHQGGHNFVLGKFKKEEKIIIKNLLPLTIKIITYFINNGFDKTANKFNGKDFQLK